MGTTFPERVLACRLGGHGRMPDVINLTDVSKSFDQITAVDRVSLSLPGGQIGAIVGPSGSGKTTLLRLIAGFERPDQGQIVIGERVVADNQVFLAPEKRRVAMVFQDYALFPHMSVRDNIAYALGRRPDQDRVERMLSLVGLTDLAERLPDNLSGGQQQRVALGRALVSQPDLLLLDEPFSGLEAGLRQEMRGELVRIIRASGVSALLVTHDCEEALSLAETVFLLHEGRLIQSGAPEQLYNQPKNLWAARFLGPINLLPGQAHGDYIDCPLGRLINEAGYKGRVDVLIRPEAIALEDGGRGIIIERSYYGHDQMLTIELGHGQRLLSRRLGPSSYRIGDWVRPVLAGPVAITEPTG